MRLATASPLAARAAAGAGVAFGRDPEAKSLLAMDGTLYSVQTGLVSDLGLVDSGVRPERLCRRLELERAGRSAGGRRHSGHREFDAQDEPRPDLRRSDRDARRALARRGLTVLNKIRLGIAQSGNWTLANLLPNLGFAHAYNPQMLLSHQTGPSRRERRDVCRALARSFRSSGGRKRSTRRRAMPPIFLDEIDASTSQVLRPAGLGRRHRADGPADIPGEPTPIRRCSRRDRRSRFSRASRSCRPTSTTSSALRSRPSSASRRSDNVTWQRRRIPVVGVANEAPIAAIPTFGATASTRSSARLTARRFMWRDDVALHYIRFDGTAWSAVRSIAFTDR